MTDQTETSDRDGGEVDQVEDDYVAVRADVDESGMESLRHGSTITYEYPIENGGTLAVTVGREDKELDKDWLLDESRHGDDDTDLTSRQWRAIAGIAAVMFGVAQAAEPLIGVAPAITGGLLALAGGIFIINQIPAAEALEAAKS